MRRVVEMSLIVLLACVMFIGCPGKRPPTPGPTPTPVPTVAPPTPDPSVCGDPLPPALYGFNLNTHSAFCANLDSTPTVKDPAYCAAIGFTDGRSICSVRTEGAQDREACEKYAVGGRPVWTVAGQGCQVFSCAVAGNCACGGMVNTNPYQAIVLGHGCAVHVCNPAQTACGTVDVP